MRRAVAGGRRAGVLSPHALLDGHPGIYLLSPNHHAADIKFDQIASFEPFTGGTPTGVTVATSSTTSGADLLVSGNGANGTEVRKYGLARPAPEATTVAPTLITTLPPLAGVAGAAPLGGR